MDVKCKKLTYMLLWIVGFITFVLICLFLTGCSDPTTSYKPAEKEPTYEEVEQKVKDFIKKKYGDDVTVKVIDKENSTKHVNWVDGGGPSYKIKGVYDYSVEISNSKYPELVIPAVYRMSYNNGTEEVSSKIDMDYDYPRVIQYAKEQQELNKLLPNYFSDFKYFPDFKYFQHTIVLCTIDFDNIDKLIMRLNDLGYSFTIYNISKKDVYDKCDFAECDKYCNAHGVSLDMAYKLVSYAYFNKPEIPELVTHDWLDYIEDYEYIFNDNSFVDDYCYYPNVKFWRTWGCDVYNDYKEYVSDYTKELIKTGKEKWVYASNDYDFIVCQYSVNSSHAPDVYSFGFYLDSIMKKKEQQILDYD